MTQASTTTAKTPPGVQKSRKPRSKPAPPSGFDFASVKPVEAKVASRRGSSARKENPAIKWVQESWDARTQTGTRPDGTKVYQGKGMALTVPHAAVTELLNLIRYAGRDLNIGTSIPPSVKGPATLPASLGGGKVPAGQTYVAFRAQTPKQSVVKKAAQS